MERCGFLVCRAARSDQIASKPEFGARSTPGSNWRRTFRGNDGQRVARMIGLKRRASGNTIALHERPASAQHLAKVIMETKLIGTGLYSLPQASRLVGADPRSVRRWLLGYRRLYRGDTRISPPLWKTELVGADLAEPTIGFRDLLELRLVNAFAKHGVHLSVIRATADAARTRFGSDYPLTMKRFLTDGKRIFAEVIEASGETHMIEPAQGQYVFSEIVTPSLYAGIDYEGDTARRWFPMGHGRKAIVLDPEIQFGTPIVTETGIPTDTLYAAFKAEGGDRDVVARIFDIQPRHVEAAVRFEERLAA